MRCQRRADPRAQDFIHERRLRRQRPGQRVEGRLAARQQFAVARELEARIDRVANRVGQIVQVESLRAQNKFADIVRGLHVYGGVVTKPQGVQVFGINTGTLTGTPRSEVWSLTITGGPTGGTYTLTVGSVATAPIAHNASNAAIATALNALAGVSEVAVTGSATSKEIRFKVDVGLTATSSLTGGTTPAVTVTAL